MTVTSSLHPFGIDFGGSGIKGAPVDLGTGEFAADRTRVETPKGGKPQDVAEVVAELVAEAPTTAPRSASPCRVSSCTAW